MLVDSPVVEMVSRKLRSQHRARVVVDPVMVAKSKVPLLSKDAYPSLKKALIPLAFLITPNLYEASILTGKRVEKGVQMKEAARIVHQMGAQNVLIKGGHLKGRPIDILYDGKDFYEFEAERITTSNTHGTGCTFSAALATEIGKGVPLIEAVKNAKDFITTAIRFSLDLGKGFGPLNPYAAFARHQELRNCGDELKRALEILKEGTIGLLIPEVQSNLGFALPQATRLDDVVAFPGRIVRLNKTIATVAAPLPGASRHIAQIILTVMNHCCDFRSAMNIKYSSAIIRKCRRLRFKCAQFDRRDEPQQINTREGASLSWGIENLLSKKRVIPDIIYDRGDKGKEPMVRVIGKNPSEVADKVVQIAN
jgi:hydroxymethylpyrimidine/phosphomethylpyrimidine kinase